MAILALNEPQRHTPSWVAMGMMDKPIGLLLRAIILALPLTACAGLDRTDQGLLQPQTVTGPCDVTKFYIVSLTTSQTRLTVANAGAACRFTVFNPDLQIVTTAALVTSPPSHGRAEAGLVFAGRQALISYTPQPGYVGPDRFAVTLEPNDRGVTLSVTVTPPP